MKHILFITTTNLTTNPRLLKEVKIALGQGFHTTVILFDFKNWSSDLEKSLADTLAGAKLIYISAARVPFWNWFASTLVQRASSILNNFLSVPLKFKAYGSDKRSFLLERKVKEINPAFSLIVAHNLGTLYPAYLFSSKYKIPFIFDVEDYHPGELIYRDANNETKRRIHIMKEILPRAAKVTAASPLIAEETRKLIGVDVTNVNNSFFSNEFIEPEDSNNSKIHFVWFSQNISKGRGLELIIPALDKYRSQIFLTLIGHTNKEFANEWLQSRDYIKIIDPLPQPLLHKTLSSFDVGLALELRCADYNRELALTNKIFAYMQAGLFILATDTKAQKSFIEQYEQTGYIMEQNSEAFINGIDFVLDNIDVLRANKLHRFNIAKGIAFEHEAKRLIDIWQAAFVE